MLYSLLGACIEPPWVPILAVVGLLAHMLFAFSVGPTYRQVSSFKCFHPWPFDSVQPPSGCLELKLGHVEASQLAKAQLSADHFGSPC